jgi:TolB-like protein
MNDNLSTENVFNQLSRILRSQAFRNSEMLRNFLSYIVREKLRKNEGNIKQYSIAVEAFGRSPNFDASNDPIVRIQAGRLRQHLEHYYYKEGISDTIRIDLPKGSYIPEFIFNAEWDDKSNTASVPHNRQISHSIAVFPIRNLSTDNSLQFVVDGFTEELLTELSRYRHLNVVRAKEEPNPSTRSSLSRFMLDGSLRFGDDLAKISLTLTDSFSQHVLWSLQRKFDRRNSDIIRLQEEISAEVAYHIGGLSGVLVERLHSESNWEKSQSPTAYDTYLHFYTYNYDNSPENTERVLAKVTQAVEAEPDFAPGWAVLARLYTDAYIFTFMPVLDKALECGKKAVQLQPNNQSCQAYYAYVLMVSEQFDKAKEHAGRTIELNPNSIYYVGAMGFLYCLMDQQDLGYELINNSISRDFRYPWWFHVGTFMYHLCREEYELAWTEADKIETPHFWVFLIRLVANDRLGRDEQAINHLQELMDIKPDFFDHPGRYVNVLLKSEPARTTIMSSLNRVLGNAEASHV